MSAADVAAVTERGMLARRHALAGAGDARGTRRRGPARRGHVVLQDPEGTPLAVLSVEEQLAVPAAGNPDDPAACPPHVRLAGPVTPLREPEHGPFRQLRRRPEEVRAEFSGGQRTRLRHPARR